MENIERITIQKRDRRYKWKYEMYKKLFYCAALFSLALLALLGWAVKGNMALTMTQNIK